MRNNIYTSGAELIMEERDRQVMINGFTIAADATKYRNGELVNAARAIIDCNIELSPIEFRDHIQKFIDLPATDRLIVAGAFIAAQIDVFNFFQNMAELLQKYAANVPEQKIIQPSN